MMDVARLSMKGQITIPADIRKKLGLKEGDKVVFLEVGENIVLKNSNRIAFEHFQRDMNGAAEQAGWNSEQDVVDTVRQVRQKMWEDQNAGNA